MSLSGTSPLYLERPQAHLEETDQSISLPYGMTTAGIVKAINELYAYVHAINAASVQYGYGRLEDFMQPAGFSGLLSNVFVRALTKSAETATPGLALNRYPNGRPDIVPRATYPGDSIKNGSEGVEIKASRASSGWQGHNAETGWILIVQLKLTPRLSLSMTDRLHASTAFLSRTSTTMTGRFPDEIPAADGRQLLPLTNAGRKNWNEGLFTIGGNSDFCRLPYCCQARDRLFRHLGILR